MEYLREWTARDRGLAEGLLTYEDSLGPHGIPWRDAMDEDMDGWFEVEERVDHAQAALDRWRAEHANGKGTEPGTRIVVVNKRPSGAAAQGT